MVRQSACKVKHNVWSGGFRITREQILPYWLTKSTQWVFKVCASVEWGESTLVRDEDRSCIQKFALTTFMSKMVYGRDV